MMTDGDYSDLATTSRNYCLYIPYVAQTDETVQEKVLLNVIEAMIDLWFIRDDLYDPQNPQLWVVANPHTMAVVDTK